MATENAPTPDTELAAQLRAECDRVGVPHDAAMLVRHHRGNAQMVGVLAAKTSDWRHDGSARILSARHSHILERSDSHDDELTDHELADAATAYIGAASYSATRPGQTMPAWTAVEYFGWPFDVDAWAPSQDPAECLATAGAYLAAEIDRIRRARGDEPETLPVFARFEVNVRGEESATTDFVLGPFDDRTAERTRAELTARLGDRAAVWVCEARDISTDDVCEFFDV